MSVRIVEQESNAKRLKDVVQKLCRGDKIDAVTRAWVRRVDTHELKLMRLEVAQESLDQLINLSTTGRLYTGDRSMIPLFEFHDEVVSGKLVDGLIEEIGSSEAKNYLWRLVDLMQLTVPGDGAGKRNR